jgi:hypothetical protein
MGDIFSPPSPPKTKQPVVDIGDADEENRRRAEALARARRGRVATLHTDRLGLLAPSEGALTVQRRSLLGS